MQDPPETVDKDILDRIAGSMMGMAIGDALVLMLSLDLMIISSSIQSLILAQVEHGAGKRTGQISSNQINLFKRLSIF